MRRPALLWIAVLMAVPSSAVFAQGKDRAIARMDHIAISVADADKSALFYEQLFGFTPVKAPVPMARWLVMGNGVMLHIVGNRRAPSAHERWDHFAVACADLDVFIAKLDARRIPWLNMEGKHVPQVRSDGIRQIFIQDPDGYWIEVNDAAKQP